MENILFTEVMLAIETPTFAYDIKNQTNREIIRDLKVNPTSSRDGINV